MPRIKPEQQKRSVAKTLRFTESEWSQIEDKVEALDMSFTRIRRQCIINVVSVYKAM